MTTVYFVRHAEPNYANHDDASRELTPKGMADRLRVTAFFADKPIDAVLSSPYKRAYDTVKHFADSRGLPIATDIRFCERRISGGWIEDFAAYCRRSWEDFDYRMDGGECLREVQERNAAALRDVLSAHRDQHIVIGSHGTALSTLINRFDPSFGYDNFMRIRDRMPWIVRFTFDGDAFLSLEEQELPEP